MPDFMIHNSHFRLHWSILSQRHAVKLVKSLDKSNSLSIFEHTVTRKYEVRIRNYEGGVRDFILLNSYFRLS